MSLIFIIIWAYSEFKLFVAPTLITVFANASLPQPLTVTPLIPVISPPITEPSFPSRYILPYAIALVLSI